MLLDFIAAVVVTIHGWRLLRTVEGIRDTNLQRAPPRRALQVGRVTLIAASMALGATVLGEYVLRGDTVLWYIWSFAEIGRTSG